MKRTALAYSTVRVLFHLLELAAQNAGFRVRGVWGWATAADVERGAKVWGAGELLRTQVQRGRVLREDVRVHGGARPQWVYRVSQAGLDALAEAVGVWPVAISGPRLDREDRVLLSDGCVVAVEALRYSAAAAAPGRRSWIEGEPEWRSSRQLTDEIAHLDELAARPYRWFTSEDLGWLVAQGLVERRVIADRAHVYRLTPAGQRVQWLEWRDPT